MRRQHLDRDVAPQARVPGAINLAHASRAYRREDLVRPEAGPGFDCHETPWGILSPRHRGSAEVQFETSATRGTAASPELITSTLLPSAETA